VSPGEGSELAITRPRREEIGRCARARKLDLAALRGGPVAGAVSCETPAESIAVWPPESLDTAQDLPPDGSFAMTATLRAEAHTPLRITSALPALHQSIICSPCAFVLDHSTALSLHDAHAFSYPHTDDQR